ncbi:MAG: hypothetical protein OEZ04_02750 [Nitrospinota bacterium]|nr:hypothetical protein [Nitrospinota bacterium]
MTGQPAPSRSLGRTAFNIVWGLLVLAMTAYSISATANTVAVYRAIPELDQKLAEVMNVREKYAKVRHYVSLFLMVKRLSKNCQELAEANLSYADYEEVQVYRQLQRLNQETSREEAKALMMRISTMAKNRDITEEIKASRGVD